jgi:transcriptional regulator with XRE-family HTH domain
MDHAGHAIKAIRTGVGMSLRELARRSDVNAGYLSQVERGTRTPDDRWLRSVEEALAKALAERNAA